MKSPIAKSTKRKPAAHSVIGRIKVSYPRINLLLVPLDFSGKSRQALRYATPLAQKFGAKVALVHVVSPKYAGPAEASGVVSDLKSEKERAVKRLEVTAMNHVPAELRGPNVVRVGSPFDEILATADKLDVDMIVLTTKGRTGIKRFFVGSTAEQVMRQATCPVLSVRRQ